MARRPPGTEGITDRHRSSRQHRVDFAKRNLVGGSISTMDLYGTFRSFR